MGSNPGIGLTIPHLPVGCQQGLTQISRDHMATHFPKSGAEFLFLASFDMATFVQPECNRRIAIVRSKRVNDDGETRARARLPKFVAKEAAFNSLQLQVP